MKNILNRFGSIPIFLALAAIVTTISLTVYCVAQQVYRQNANDPQIEVSDAVAEAMQQGAPAEAIVDQSGSIDFSKHLSLFIMIFDKDSKLVASSGKIGEETPVPATRDIESAKQNGSNRFTWKPKDGVKVAAVLKKVNDEGQVVLVGKNLREVEVRTRNLIQGIVISWGILMVLSGILTWLLNRKLGNLTVVEENIVLAETPDTEQK